MPYIRAKDRIGTTVNGFYIKDTNRDSKRTYALVVCPYCQKEKWIRMEYITSAKCVSCGCYNAEHNFIKSVDITGAISGRLKAIKPTSEKSKSNGSVIWECECECGNKTYVSETDLARKKIKSCGCLELESQRQNGKKVAGYVKDTFGVDGTNICHIKEKKILRNNTSGIRGVFWDNTRQKWVAQIEFKGKNYRLGRFDKKEDAAEIRKIAEKEMFGTFIEQWEREKLEEKLQKLTSKQHEIYSLYLSGKKQSAIAKELGLSRQYISVTIKSAEKRIAEEQQPKEKKQRKPYTRTKPIPERPHEDMSKYAQMDMSILSEKQKRVLQYRLAGKTNKEIAGLEDISMGAVNAVIAAIKRKTGDNKDCKIKSVKVDKNIDKVGDSYAVFATYGGKTIYLATVKTLDEAQEIRDTAELKKKEEILNKKLNREGETFLEWKNSLPRSKKRNCKEC